MVRVWAKYSDHAVTPEVRRIYFPICDDVTSFENRLREMNLDLQRVNPVIYDMLLRAQPFSTDRNTLRVFSELSNLGKHVRLVRQHKSSRPAWKRTFVGSVIITAPPSKDAFEDPAQAEGQSVTWVTHSVEGYDSEDPYIFCASLFSALRQFIPNLLVHLEKEPSRAPSPTNDS
jgi:hypothetical protein